MFDKKFFIFLLLFSCFFTELAWGKQDRISDSVNELKEVIIYGIGKMQHPHVKYSQFFPDTLISKTPSFALSELVASSTPFFIRSWGNRQFSTLQFRGISSGNSALLWNGINVTSPVTGILDLSQFSSFLHDEVAIYSGSGGSWFGNNASGGTILTGNYLPKFNQDLSMKLLGEFGSFDRYFSGFDFKVSNHYFHSDTKASLMNIANAFPFYSAAEDSTIEMPNSGVNNFGFSQQIGIKPSTNHLINANFLFNRNHQASQPALPNLNQADSLLSDNLRASIDYFFTSAWGTTNAKFGYINEDMMFVNSIDSMQEAINSGSMIYRLQHSKKFEHSNLLAAIQYNQLEGEIPEMDKAVSENRYEAMLSYNRTFLGLLDLTFSDRLIHIRETDEWVHVPSFITDVNFLKNHDLTLKWRNSIGKNFRLPTLYERYGMHGNLAASIIEDGYSGETGLQTFLNKKQAELEFSTVFYHSRINNMNAIMPFTTFHIPSMSLESIVVNGLETQISGDYELGKINLRNQQQLIINDSRVELNTDSAIPQLPVVTASSKLAASRKINGVNYSMELFNQYIGSQQLSTQDEELPSLLLTNVNATVSFDINPKERLDIRFALNNFSDREYFLVPQYLMPGANTTLSVAYAFN